MGLPSFKIRPTQKKEKGRGHLEAISDSLEGMADWQGRGSLSGLHRASGSLYGVIPQRRRVAHVKVQPMLAPGRLW